MKTLQDVWDITQEIYPSIHAIERNCILREIFHIEQRSGLWGMIEVNESHEDLILAVGKYITRKFKIEFWFRYGLDQKDFDVEEIEANSFAEAVEKLKAKHSHISIFKTEMLCNTHQQTSN